MASLAIGFTNDPTTVNPFYIHKGQATPVVLGIFRSRELLRGKKKQEKGKNNKSPSKWKEHLKYRTSPTIWR